MKSYVAHGVDESPFPISESFVGLAKSVDFFICQLRIRSDKATPLSGYIAIHSRYPQTGGFQKFADLTQQKRNSK